MTQVMRVVVGDARRHAGAGHHVLCPVGGDAWEDGPLAGTVVGPAEAVNLLHQGRRHLDPALARGAALGAGAAHAEAAAGGVMATALSTASSPPPQAALDREESGASSGRSPPVTAARIDGSTPGAILRPDERRAAAGKRGALGKRMLIRRGAKATAPGRRPL